MTPQDMQEHLTAIVMGFKDLMQIKLKMDALVGLVEKDCKKQGFASFNVNGINYVILRSEEFVRLKESKVKKVRRK